MATPLQKRSRIKEAQKQVRLTLNAFHSALDTWKITVDAGKAQATDLGNALLHQTDTLPHFNLSKAFPNHPCDLSSALYQRVHYQQTTSLSSLQQSLSTLQECVDKLASAIAPLDALLEQGQEEPTLGPNAPVYAALPLHAIVKLFRQVLDMHVDEFRIKEAVVKDYQVEVLNREEKIDGTTTTTSDKTSPRRQRIQVLIAAWLLSPEIDDKQVKCNLLEIMEDMKGF